MGANVWRLMCGVTVWGLMCVGYVWGLCVGVTINGSTETIRWSVLFRF